MAKKRKDKENDLIGNLNYYLERLSKLNGKSIWANMKELGIPYSGNKCQTNQLSGYAELVKSELLRVKDAMQ